MIKLLKLSRKKIVRALIFYLFALFLYLTFMKTLNKQHIESSYLLVVNVGLFTGCYWGVIYAMGSNK